MGESVRIRLLDGAAIGAWYAKPPRTAAGGVVVVQEIFGVNAHVRSIVERYASLGYETIAPALFDLVEPGVELGYDATGVERGRDLAAKVGFDRAVSAVASAAQYLGCPGQIAVIGYCWGGTIALLANTRLGLPAVDYYGGRSLPFLHERPRAPLLIHFGNHDPIIPPHAIERHRSALPEAQIHVYEAGHGFNCEQRSDYDAKSAALALQRTLDFLARTQP